MRTGMKFAVVSSLAIVLAACGNPKDANQSNFSKAIQTYLDTQKGLCAAIPDKDIPFTLMNKEPFGQERKKKADALADAGLLSKRDTEAKALFGNRMEPAIEYQLTDMGKKFLVSVAPEPMARQFAFCTGKYSVVEVDNFTDPSEMLGVKVSRVNFRYKVENAADWAKAEGLRASYDDFAGYAKGSMEGKAALILTNEGWMHERLFKR